MHSSSESPRHLRENEFKMYFALLVLLLVMQKQKNRTKIRNEERATLVEQPTTLQVTSILISLSKKIASQLKNSKQSAALEASAA